MKTKVIVIETGNKLTIKSPYYIVFPFVRKSTGEDYELRIAVETPLAEMNEHQMEQIKLAVLYFNKINLFRFANDSCFKETQQGKSIINKLILNALNDLDGYTGEVHKLKLSISNGTKRIIQYSNTSMRSLVNSTLEICELLGGPNTFTIEYDDEILSTDNLLVLKYADKNATSGNLLEFINKVFDDKSKYDVKHYADSCIKGRDKIKWVTRITNKETYGVTTISYQEPSKFTDINTFDETLHRYMCYSINIATGKLSKDLLSKIIDIKTNK